MMSDKLFMDSLHVKVSGSWKVWHWIRIIGNNDEKLDKSSTTFLKLNYWSNKVNGIVIVVFLANFCVNSIMGQIRHCWMSFVDKFSKIFKLFI